ncbi:MAG: ribosome-binding factor A [Patescibacteria group bacterium]
MIPRNIKLANLIKELSAGFLGLEDNKSSLITVTDCTISPDMKRGTLFITVLPISKENAALGFAKRQRSGLREFLKKNLKTKIIPFLDIEIDAGEKKRQKIDELLFSVRPK